MAHSDLSTLEPGTLRVAAFAGFAPFAWRDGPAARGRDITFLGRFAAAEGLRLAVDFGEFDRLWEQPARGRADLAASGISRIPGDDRRAAAWSRPYAEVRRTVLLQTANRPRFRSMADFAHATVAAVPGSAAEDHARRTLPGSATLVPAATLERGIADLLAGRIDGLGTGSLSAEHHQLRHRTLARLDVHADGEPERIAFAVRDSHTLVARLDAFITRHGHLY